MLSLLFSNTQYIPHGHCYLWQTPLVVLHVAGDALVAIAYYAISIFLVYFIYQSEEDLPFKNTFILVSGFFLSSGMIHLLEIWIVWHPAYWLLGIFKILTALISLCTVLNVTPLIPNILKLLSPQYEGKLNQQLIAEVTAKKNSKQVIEQLNQKSEKTAALLRANQDLQEITNFREKLTDLTPSILYLFDLETGLNVYCNSSITDLLGYTPLEIQKFKNKLLHKLVHPEDLSSVQQHFQNCLALKGDNYLEIEYRVRDIYGNWHWLKDKNVIFARDDDGKPLQLLGIAQDVSKYKQAEEERQRLTKKLEEKIALLERTNLGRIKLAQMNEFIQACVTIDEAQQILPDMLKPLFSGSRGAVYLMSNSKNLLDKIASWGNVKSDLHFDPKQCWGIRRGNIHHVDPHSPGLYCSHIDTTVETTPNLCLPMIAEGETIGMFYLCFDRLEIDLSVRNLAETVAQNLAMSFANLKLQEKLRYQSLRDPLTGLYNRRYLKESLTSEIDRAYRKQQFVSVLMLDVDHFKRFNDVYGHSAGDLVLSSVGTYLLAQIRQYDIACRYGGEELVIVMPDASIENTIVRAEEIREGIKKIELKHEGKKLESISVSIGVSCFPDDGTNAEGLIRAADKALYLAKEMGRDCVQRC